MVFKSSSLKKSTGKFAITVENLKEDEIDEFLKKLREDLQSKLVYKNKRALELLGLPDDGKLISSNDADRACEFARKEILDRVSKVFNEFKEKHRNCEFDFADIQSVPIKCGE